MSATVLSVPGKTFLIGEYVALDGGPSILLATNPRFELRIEGGKGAGEKQDASAFPFAPQSPAGRYLSRYPEDFQGLQVSFDDPHRGLGGLGASSAQFALLHAYRSQRLQRTLHSDQVHQTRRSQISQSAFEGSFANKNGLFSEAGSDLGDTFDWASLLAEYRACAWNGEGTPPSGADVVAQLNGGITWFDGRNHVTKKLQWRFPSLAFTLLRTGFKLATHEHLRTTQAAPHEALRAAVVEATNSFATGQSAQLVQAVDRASAILQEAGLTAQATQDLLRGLRAESGLCLAAKGCGAMGADIVLVVHEASKEQAVRDWARARGLTRCGSQDDLSSGLEIQHETETGDHGIGREKRN